MLPHTKKQRQPVNPLQYLLGAGAPQQTEEPKVSEEEQEKHRSLREETLARLRAGQLENEIVEIEVEESVNAMMFGGAGMEFNMGDMLGDIGRKLIARPRDASDVDVIDETRHPLNNLCDTIRFSASS